MATPAVIGGHASPLAQVAASLLIAVLAVNYGRSAAKLLALPFGEPFTTSFVIVVGFVALSLVHLAATTALHLAGLGALWIDAIAAAVLQTMAARADRLHAPADAGTGAAGMVIDAVALVCVGAMASVWAREAVTAFSHAQATGEFRAWQDYFLHATEITYVRDYATYAGESLYLRGFPQPFYHRASYAMPALFSALSGSPSVMAATAFWLPLGLTLCGVAAYGFGAVIGGRAGGLGAAAVLFLVPDASRYWLGNPWFSFFWLAQTGAGAGYAIAATLIALALLLRRTRADAGRGVLASVALAVCATLFRVHIAALGVPLVTVMGWLIWPAPLRKKVVTVGLVALFALLTAVAFEWIELAPHFFTARPDHRAYFDFVLTQGPDQGAYYRRLGGSDSSWGIVSGLALTLIGAFGAMLPAAMALAIARGRGALDRRPAALAVLVPVLYVAVVLLMPTPAHGDYTEYGHRAFVCAYAVLAAFVGAAIGRRMRPVAPRSAIARILTASALAIALACAALVPWRQGREIQQRWGPQFSVVPMAPDAIAAASYIRAHSSPGDHILASNEDPRAMFVGLTERPAFLSRSDLFRRLGGTAAALADARAAEHTALTRIVDYDDLRGAARKLGISWYIAGASDNPLWPAALKAHCNYCGSDLRVFDLR